MTPHPQPGVPLAKVLLLLEAGRARGVWPSAWCEAEGITPGALADVDLASARVPAVRVVALWEALVEATGDPGFPLEVARRMRLEAYDVYGFAVLTSPDVGTALARASRFFALTGNPGALAVTDDGAHARVTHARATFGASALGVRCAVECVLAQVAHIVREVLRDPVTPRAVTFAHPAPARVDAHACFFGVAPAFDAARHELVYDRALLARPLAPVDGSLSAFYEHHAARLVRALDPTPGPSDPFVAAVRDALAGGAFDAPPELPDVARRLALSERTLRRRLAERGATFRGLRDEVMRGRAEALLARPGAAIAEVAFVLGFSDAAAFHRAFRRWTGVTPQAWRRREPS